MSDITSASLRQAAILGIALYLAQFPGELVWGLVKWAPAHAAAASATAFW